MLVLHIRVSSIVFTTGKGFTVIFMVSFAEHPAKVVPVTINIRGRVSINKGLAIIESLT